MGEKTRLLKCLLSMEIPMDSYLFGGKMSHGQPISITIPLHGSQQHFVLVFFFKKKVSVMLHA